jgi:hypothetical protein
MRTCSQGGVTVGVVATTTNTTGGSSLTVPGVETDPPTSAFQPHHLGAQSGHSVGVFQPPPPATQPRGSVGAVATAATSAVPGLVFQSPSPATQSRGPAEKPVLDTLFRTSSPLPQVLHGSFVRVPRADLLVGYLIAEVSTPEPSLFRISSIYPDVTIKSMLDSQVTGCLVSVTSCWVATARGLSVLSPRIPQASYEPLVPAAVRVEAHPSVEFSVMDLFRAAGSSASSSTTVVSLPLTRPVPATTPRGVVALPRGPVSNGIGPPIFGGPTGVPSSDTIQASDIFSPARQDRYEAARGLRTLLGHNSSRLMDITNNTGNCGDDRAFNNVIVDMLPDDRSLPALSRQQLKHLLTLQFAYTYDSAKPTGIHLQAFRD